MSDQDLEIHREGSPAKSPPDPAAVDDADAIDFRFTLYICGATEMSRRAVVQARRLCEEHLQGRYVLEVVDLYQRPELAHSRDIFAIPTLVQELPTPIRRYIGDLHDNARLVVQMTPRDVKEP